MQHLDITKTIATGRLGGDFWNPTSIAYAARRRSPSAIAFEYDYIGTGLWVDGTIIEADGSRSSVRLFS